MKKLSLFVITAVITLSVFILPASANYTVSNPESSIESSDVVSDSGYVNIEPALKKTRWKYYLCAGLSTAGVIAAAVIITKRNKE